MENIDEDQFKFLMKIAKKYAFQLPDEVERAKALKWLKKLGEASDPNVLKVKHHTLQILLMCLQSGKLVGPFADGIEKQTQFLEYAWSYQPEDIAEELLKSEERHIGEPDISYEMSGDLTEFTSYQEIPNFGMHFYYAFSPEDFLKWDNLSSALVPPGLLNLAKIHQPESSSIAQALNTAEKEKVDNKKEAGKQYAEQIEKQATEFVDVSMISKFGKIKEGFKDENPPASELNTDLLDKAIDAGVVDKEEIQIEKGIIPEGEKVRGPHVEKVKIKKGEQKLVKKKKWKNLISKDKSELDEAEEKEVAAEARRKELEKEKEELLARMPAALRERLAGPKQKIERKAKPLSPEAFRENYTGPKKKWKMEEFGLKRTEKWASAKTLKNLEMSPRGRLPRKGPKRMAIPKKYQHLFTSHRVEDTEGIIGKDEEAEIAADECALALKESFEKSMEKRQLDRATETHQGICIDEKKQQLLDHLNQIKRSEFSPRNIDDIAVEIEPEDVLFERFIYQELPEESGNVSILSERDMRISDVFGEDVIADIDVLPKAPPLEDLEKQEILSEERIHSLDYQVLYPDPFQRAVRECLDVEMLAEQTFPSDHGGLVNYTPPWIVPSSYDNQADELQDRLEIAKARRLHHLAQEELAKKVTCAKKIAQRLQSCRNNKANVEDYPLPPIEYPDDLLEPIEFVDYPSERCIFDESIQNEFLPQSLIQAPCPRDFLQFDDSIGSPPPDKSRQKDKWEAKQRMLIAQQYGIETDALSENIADISFPAIPTSPCLERSKRETPPTRAFRPQDRSRSSNVRRRLFDPSQRMSVVPQTLEERFEMLAAGINERPSLRMSPRERITELIKRAPKVKVKQLPHKTGLSPPQFVTKLVTPTSDLLENESFPEEDMYTRAALNTSELGPLAYSLYIPTREEEEEFERFHRKRRQLSPIHFPTPPPRSPFEIGNEGPIGRTDVLPEEEGFKWLDNYVPWDVQFPPGEEDRLHTPRNQLGVIPETSISCSPRTHFTQQRVSKSPSAGKLSAAKRSSSPIKDSKKKTEKLGRGGLKVISTKSATTIKNIIQSKRKSVPDKKSTGQSHLIRPGASTSKLASSKKPVGQSTVSTSRLVRPGPSAKFLPSIKASGPPISTRSQLMKCGTSTAKAVPSRPSSAASSQLAKPWTSKTSTIITRSTRPGPSTVAKPVQQSRKPMPSKSSITPATASRQVRPSIATSSYSTRLGQSEATAARSAKPVSSKKLTDSYVVAAEANKPPTGITSKSTTASASTRPVPQIVKSVRRRIGPAATPGPQSTATTSQYARSVTSRLPVHRSTRDRCSQN